MIKALIIDFGGVIYKTKWALINQYFFDKNGFNILVGNSKDEELIRIYNDSDIGKEDFKNFFIRLNPYIKDINSILKDYKEGYIKFKVLNEELLKMVLNIKGKGIKLFGFTDTKKEHYEANLQSGIFEGFETIFTSFKFGYLKSHPNSFKLLTEELKKYGLTPDECLFIDDNMENLERAGEMGYHTILYKEFPKIEKISEQLKGFLD